MKKKKIITIGAFVLLVCVFGFLYISKASEAIKLERENDTYKIKIKKLIKEQTSGITSYELDEGTYKVGNSIFAGVATIVALDGSGSYYISNGDKLVSSGLIAEYENFKINQNFKSVVKVKLESGETLKLLGDDLKVSLIYNIREDEYEKIDLD